MKNEKTKSARPAGDNWIYTINYSTCNLRLCGRACRHSISRFSFSFVIAAQQQPVERGYLFITRRYCEMERQNAHNSAHFIPRRIVASAYRPSKTWKTIEVDLYKGRRRRPVQCAGVPFENASVNETFIPLASQTKYWSYIGSRHKSEISILRKATPRYQIGKSHQNKPVYE